MTLSEGDVIRLYVICWDADHSPSDLLAIFQSRYWSSHMYHCDGPSSNASPHAPSVCPAYVGISPGRRWSDIFSGEPAPELVERQENAVCRRAPMATQTHACGAYMDGVMSGDDDVTLLWGCDEFCDVELRVGSAGAVYLKESDLEVDDGCHATFSAFGRRKWDDCNRKMDNNLMSSVEGSLLMYERYYSYRPFSYWYPKGTRSALLFLLLFFGQGITIISVTSINRMYAFRQNLCSYLLLPIHKRFCRCGDGIW